MHFPFLKQSGGVNGNSKLRNDIQVLRGFAVLIVLFYHAKIGGLSAGYLGVDVFFVISGFLITGVIKKSIERGNFSFAGFYLRRAKRLLPAAYVTFLITALLAKFFLGENEMIDFRSQMIGAVTFMANITLWQQSGYFDGPAELKPFLHVWSLSIEEQYYFILPALMFFIPRHLWKRAGILILVASLALCQYMVHRSVDATFFLLPTRGWELAIGSVGALILAGDRLERFLKFTFWPALAVLLTLPFMKVADFHPGPDAMLVCVATLVIVLRKHPLLFHGPAMGMLGKVGDISYSLYLVHWPLFAFLNNSWIGEGEQSEPPVAIRLGFLVFSLLLAWLLNRYIEEPSRRFEFKRTRLVLARTFAVSLLLVTLPFGLNEVIATEKDYTQIRRHNLGFDKACDFSTNFEPIAECRNSDQPEILIWGDSYAMHLVPGILAAKNEPPRVVQATRSACGPFLGIAITNEKYSQKWAESCIDFNDSVVAYLTEAGSVGTVVLSTPFAAHLGEDGKLVKKDYSQGKYELVNAGKGEAMVGLKKTIDKIRSLGKRVVVVAPPPSSGGDSSLCLERLERNILTFGVSDECSINDSARRKYQGKVLEFLETLPIQVGVEVIHPSDFLCNGEVCKTYIDDTFIYRDKGHLSYDGSVLLANKMGLAEKIKTMAK